VRTRVLAPILACVLLVVVAIAVPALQAISRERTQELVLQRSTSLMRFASLARSSIDSGDRTALVQHGQTYVRLYGEPVLVIDPSGRAVFETESLSLDEPAVAAAATAARRNQPIDTLPVVFPWSGSHHLMAQPVVGTGDLTGGAVITRVDAGRAVADVRERWALALAAAAAGLLVLTALGLLLGRWVVRPVRELDLASRALASGRLPDRLRRTGPPELRRLAQSFDEMAASVTGTIRERGRLVEDFSHRLRNPLAALRLRIDALAHDESDAKRGAALAQVDRDLDRLERMVDTLLDLAEAEHRTGAGSVSGLLEPDERPLELTCDLFADEVLARWATQSAQRGVRLVREGLDHVGLRCSAMDAHDMVDELVENALRYAGHGADVVLRIALRAASGHTAAGPAQRVALIEVADTGPGLGQDELDHALERFWRSPEQRDTDGTGLGLAIVSQLARANRGHVDLHPNDPHGLRVRLTLPAVGDA
jgi:signal transduction histidine kinase